MNRSITRCKVGYLARETFSGIMYFLLLVAFAALVVSLVGCAAGAMIDPATGLPTTQPTDAATVVEHVGAVIQTTAPTFGPWGLVVAAVTGALVPVIAGMLRKKKPKTL